MDIGLVGHDHIYERFQPLDPTGAYDPVFGIKHFTVGTGGEAHHTAGTPLPTSEATRHRVSSPATPGIHAAVTYSGSTYNFYLDGALRPDSRSAGPRSCPRRRASSTPGVGTAMNSSGVAGGFFQGVVDEVRIYANVARSLTDIQTAKNTEIGAQPGLIGLWHFNEGSTTTAVDASGRGNNGTLLPAAGPPNWATGFDVSNAGVQLNGTSQFVSFGASAGTWRTGRFPRSPSSSGSSGPARASGTGTGTGGLASAIPLITKGRNEAGDAGQREHELLLRDRCRERQARGRLRGHRSTAANHPATGTAVVTSNAWHHAAVTYSGSTYNFYLDGALDRTVDLGTAFVPEATSVQHAGVGTAHDTRVASPGASSRGSSTRFGSGTSPAA